MMTHLDIFFDLLWRRYIVRVAGEREDSPVQRINDEVDQCKCVKNYLQQVFTQSLIVDSYDDRSILHLDYDDPKGFRCFILLPNLARKMATNSDIQYSFTHSCVWFRLLFVRCVPMRS